MSWADVFGDDPAPVGVSRRAPRGKQATLGFAEPRRAPVAIKYRWYQDEAHARLRATLKEHRSALLVMATGSGKTQVFSRFAHEWPNGFDGAANPNVLVLAHRKELVRQAAETLAARTGEPVGIEMAEERGGKHVRLVVGSIQSMTPQRLERLGKDRFGLVIVDECHRALAPTYRRALDWFDAKVLGVTATPDRGDEKALGAVFDEVAFVYEILDGIDDGFLVPFTGRSVELASIDISGVDVSKGDLAVGQLDEAMLKAVEGVTTKTLELGGTRQGIIFWPGVKSAEHADLRFNAMKPGCSAVVSGQTDDDERDEIIRRYQAGAIQYLQNCQVFTEGFDAPATSLVAMARPTKSRALVAQCVGRGARPLKGCIDSYPGKEDAQARRAAIAASAKPDLLILDFVGNCGKHTLMGPVDVLAGNYTEAEVKVAKKKVKDGGQTNLREALEAARAQLRELASKTKSRVTATVKEFNPFELMNVQEPSAYARRFGFRPMSDGQRNTLLKFGFKPDDLAEVDKTGASKLIDAAIKRANDGLCSFGQLKQLQRFGIADKRITRDRAAAAMNYLAQKGWGAKGGIDTKALYDLVFPK